MQQTLIKEGFKNITSIQNSTEVIPQFLKSCVSLILLDINIPGLSGSEVVENLK